MGFNSKLRLGIDLSRAKRAEGPSRDSENMEVFRALGVQVRVRPRFFDQVGHETMDASKAITLVRLSSFSGDKQTLRF